MRKSQHVACREGWFDNLSRTVFHVSHPVEVSEEGEKIDEKFDKAIADLEQNMEQEIQDSIQKGLLLTY